MCTRERTLQFQLTEEEREGEGRVFTDETHARRRTRRKTRGGWKRAIPRASEPLSSRGIGNSRTRGFRCRRKRVSPFAPPPATRATGPDAFRGSTSRERIIRRRASIVEILESWWRRVAFTRFRYDDSLLCGEARSRLTAIYERRGEKEK